MTLICGAVGIVEGATILDSTILKQREQCEAGNERFDSRGVSDLTIDEE